MILRKNGLAFRKKVLGQVSSMLEQRDFQLLCEETLGQALAFLRQGSGLELVPGSLDDLQLKGQFRESGAALGQDLVGLGEGQGAAASCDGDGVGGRHGWVKELNALHRLHESHEDV